MKQWTYNYDLHTLWILVKATFLALAKSRWGSMVHVKEWWAFDRDVTVSSGGPLLRLQQVALVDDDGDPVALVWKSEKPMFPWRDL